MLQKLQYRTDQKGFTLIELMIVIAIIGILAAIAIPQFNAYRRRSFRTKAQSMLTVMRSAQGGLNLDVGGVGASQFNQVMNQVVPPIIGDVLDAGNGPLIAATEAVAGTALTAVGVDQLGNNEIRSFPIDVPQGVIAQCRTNAALGGTYNASTWSYNTDRQFALDFNSQQTLYVQIDPAPPAWQALTPLNNALPAGPPVLPTPADDYFPLAPLWTVFSK